MIDVHGACARRDHNFVTTLWEVGEEELVVQRSVKQQDSVLGSLTVREYI